MQRPDRRVSLIVDLNHVFSLRSVLKDLSTVHDVAGRVSAMRIALRTAGNRVVCVTSSIIPRELSSSFCTSYHARASSTRLSMPYISLTDETMCLNSSLSVCCISLGCCVGFPVVFADKRNMRINETSNYGSHTKRVEREKNVLKTG